MQNNLTNGSALSHPLEAFRRWENGHHLFSVLIQGLIVVHAKLERVLKDQDWKAADGALTDATSLWLACSAAFHFTGDFVPEVFDMLVRPSMAPPFEREGFSGLFSADHVQLIQQLMALRPLLEALPAQLKPRHRTYLWALDAVYESHAMVCELHVGEKPSLKGETASSSAPSAPDVIRNLKRRTLRQAGQPDSET